MRKYLSCLAAALFSFYNLFQFSLFNVLSTELLNHFQITPSMLGVLSSFFLWGNVVGFIPIGLLLDSGYVRKTALFLLAASIISSFMLAFLYSLPMAMFARFIQGLASAASLLICMRLGIHWFKEKANLAIGWMMVIALSGGIFGNSIYAYIMRYLNYEYGLIVAGMVGVVILCVLILFLHDNKPASIALTFKDHLNLFRKAMYKISNILIGVYMGLINFPVFVLGTLWGNYYLSQFYPFTSLQISFLSALIFVGIIIGSPLWGVLAERYINSDAIMRIGCVSLMLLAWLLYLLPGNFYILQVIFLGYGVFSATQNIAYYKLSKINQPEVISSATAIAALVFNMLGAGSQIIYGVIISQPQSFAFLAILPLLGLILLLACK